MTGTALSATVVILLKQPRNVRGVISWRFREDKNDRVIVHSKAFVMLTITLLSALLVSAVAQLGQICDRTDCLNRGACLGMKSAPLCLCDIGYQGARCEIEPLCSNLIACTNNGLCLGTARNFVCLCNIGFSGPNCALPVGK